MAPLSSTSSLRLPQTRLNHATAEDGEDLGPNPQAEDLEDPEDAVAIPIHPSLRALSLGIAESFLGVIAITLALFMLPAKLPGSSGGRTRDGTAKS